MFKKIASNLPFSPSLISQLGFYAGRLKKEQSVRRLGLIVTIFALIIQSLAVFNRPESVNATELDQNYTFSQVSSQLIELSKSATNNSQDNNDATQVTARAGDVISFTIHISNPDRFARQVDITDSLADTLEYANLIDYGGGQFDENSQSLSWSNITLEPNEQTARSFAATVKNPVPHMAQGQSNSESYNCMMTNVAGNAVNISVDCPTLKQIEHVIGTLPQTGIGANVAFAGILLFLAVFLYARSRQLSKEVRLLRKEFNAGAL